MLFGIITVCFGWGKVMIKRFQQWFINVSIEKKFVPLQTFIIVLVALIGILSTTSVMVVNRWGEQIIDENVNNREQLNNIIRNMYVCRVLGRDILLQEDPETLEILYSDYIQSFEELDYKMDVFAKRMQGEKLEEFNQIIGKKNEYKDSMILSADIKIQGGADVDALHALTVVTPIANEFFGSIDLFLADEQAIMDETLARNDAMVRTVMVLGIVVNVVAIIALVFFVKFFAKATSSSLIALEKSVSKIAKTGNMKIEIPVSLYTNDEVGRIAVVVDKLKMMLLEYSFRDSLTGGYNAKAYHEELVDIFASEAGKVKRFWCVIADMNNLKQINDNLGHVEGDSAIRKSYIILNAELERFGKIFRIGGDEFAAILYGCDEEALKEAIELVNEKIAAVSTHSTLKFSLAIGYGEFCGYTRQDYEQLFETVDKKMYLNKHEIKHGRPESRMVDCL